MIKMNSISGLIFYVKDIEKTKNFYKTVGFNVEDTVEGCAKAYLNWFWMEFISVDKAEETVFKKDLQTGVKSTGPYVQISVADVDEFHAALLDKGIKSASEPQTFAWKRREFIVHDPDGYRLVFFQKK